MSDHAADLAEAAIAAVLACLAIWLRVQFYLARARRRTRSNDPDRTSDTTRALGDRDRA